MAKKEVGKMDEKIERWKAELSALLEEGKTLEQRLREIKLKINKLSWFLQVSIDLDKWQIKEETAPQIR